MLVKWNTYFFITKKDTVFLDRQISLPGVSYETVTTSKWNFGLHFLFPTSYEK